jgi:DNA mismatch endonuclease (patch repair protein)
MDKLTPEQRSRNMARIRSRDTAPEMAVRRFLHRSGLRFRVHRRDLPGKPDLVFPSRRLCLFVHGCFWHGCPNCIDGTRAIKSNTAYWGAKIEGNRTRDACHRAALEADGWTVMVLWECEVRDSALLDELANVIRGVPRQ